MPEKPGPEIHGPLAQHPSQEGLCASVLRCSLPSALSLEMLLLFCPTPTCRSLETRVSSFSVFLITSRVPSLLNLTQDFGGGGQWQWEESLLEPRVSALSWSPTSSLELQTKSFLCLAGSATPTSGPKGLGFYV